MISKYGKQMQLISALFRIIHVVITSVLYTVSACTDTHSNSLFVA